MINSPDYHVIMLLHFHRVFNYIEKEAFILKNDTFYSINMKKILKNYVKDILINLIGSLFSFQEFKILIKCKVFGKI